MPAQQGTLNVLNDSAFVVLMVPVSTFQGVDDNHDTRLSNAEVLTHNTALQAQIRARFRVYTTHTQSSSAWSIGTQTFVSVRAEHDEQGTAPGQGPDSVGAKHILVLLKAQFEGAPDAIRVETDLFGTAPEERVLTLRTTRNAETAVARLTPEAMSYEFFIRPQAEPSASPTYDATSPWYGWLALGCAVAILGWRLQRREVAV